MPRTTPTLEDKYALERGSVYLSGIQALVRLPLEQRARDAAAGLHTAGFVSGYRGSPLAGLDLQIAAAAEHYARREVVFQPGLNEELAATAVWGSQQTGLHPGARYDGVFGLWYGKAPGVDRASDALRHANAAGTARHGGVLLVAGDDHACKSSSYPSQSELLMQHLEIPVLAPASVQEVLDYGLYGWAMSRYAGLWVSLIALTDLMDGSAVIRVGPDRAPVVVPADVTLPRGGVHIRAGDDPRAQERRLREVKLPAAIAFARANGIDHVVFDADRPRLVVVASGKAWTDTRQALADLGIDARMARDIGLRLVKIGMPWPLDAATMRRLVAGSEQVLVVEEKRPVIEPQLRDALYDLPGDRRPRVLGKRDANGAPLLAEVLELDAARIAEAIVHVLPPDVGSDTLDDHAARLAARASAPRLGPVLAERRPWFCSGCPHNTSTRVPEGSRALVGIGCHYMVQWMDRDTDHVCQMGGEGAAWIGQAPFTEESHVFANLGDGTYAHSGILAIRAAVAAGVNITYKLLYNDAVAMTGGQPAEGAFGVAQITRQLAAEGVRTIAIVADDPGRYRDGCGLAPGVAVEPRARLDVVQKRLRAAEGVSVLIYDQTCAAEQRRRRKRGQLPDPARRVFINEQVCEGCGDCSAASNCLSVQPVETELGRKRRIDQSSCNKDWSCADASCPSFVNVVGGRIRRQGTGDPCAEASALPRPPVAPIRDVYGMVLTGVGGTGVTTVAALLGMAAHIDGRASQVLDVTGLAQKGGAVISHVRLAEHPERIHGARVPAHGADLLIGCDLVVAAGKEGAYVLDATRTRAVLCTHLVPTAEFVLDNGVHYDTAGMEERVRRATRSVEAVDAVTICQRTLGDAMPANVFLLGHAWQLGWIPVSFEAIDRAIEMNGVAVEMNRRAFALGRLAAHDRKKVEDRAAVGAAPERPRGLDDTIERRAAYLRAYQDEHWAARYCARVEQVRAVEAERLPGSERLAEAVAESLFRLMAYKDEYEIARLYSDGRFRQALEETFEGDFRVELLLSPPAFARRDPDTGRLRKRAYGPWMLRVLGALARLKGLRGTAFDPFGWLPERRLERALIAEYESTLDRILDAVSADNAEVAVELAALPQTIRGFDHVKRDAVERARARRDALMSQLG
jgi:indolepyruvate ferredoxin oxidoreductase